MYFIALILTLISCGSPEYSPWQSNPEHHDLTAKHLAWLDGADKPFEPFTVAISGDPQAVVGHFRRVIDVVNHRDDADFLVILGDITDLGMRREWIWIGDSIEESNKPILTVVGNHDGLMNGKDIYEKMFGPFNYSFIHKDVKFIMWNNNPYEWGIPDFDWLEGQIASHSRVIVLSHQPPGSTDTDPNGKWEELRKHPNMIASLHGHVHNYGFRMEEKLPIYTVDRVTGSHYGTITIYEDSVELSNCSPTCSIVKEK